MSSERNDLRAEAIDWSKGAAYIDGRFMPLSDAKIPVTDWGYRRSDVTYDVVGVYYGAFFRLDDHLRRFRASMDKLRMKPPETNEQIRTILMDLVARTGLREAYVAMDCLRGRPLPGRRFHPVEARNYLVAYAMPWVNIFSEEKQLQGIHVIVAKTPRIAEDSVDPTAKNFHWGDFTKALFEADEQNADTAVLLDRDGLVTEGPGFNVFSITDGKVVSPDRGSLEGVTRLSVFELCDELGIPHEIRALPVEQLRDADEIFLATTAGGIMPVSRVDGRMMGNDRPGPISMALRERFWKRRAEGWHATPVIYDQAAA